MHYWPSATVSLDISQWNEFFDAATELKNFNWKSLLDDHFNQQKLPLIFHQVNLIYETSLSNIHVGQHLRLLRSFTIKQYFNILISNYSIQICMSLIEMLDKLKLF